MVSDIVELKLAQVNLRLITRINARIAAESFITRITVNGHELSGIILDDSWLAINRKPLRGIRRGLIL